MKLPVNRLYLHEACVEGRRNNVTQHNRRLEQQLPPPDDDVRATPTTKRSGVIVSCCRTGGGRKEEKLKKQKERVCACVGVRAHACMCVCVCVSPNACWDWLQWSWPGLRRVDLTCAREYTCQLPEAGAVKQVWKPDCAEASFSSFYEASRGDMFFPEPRGRLPKLAASVLHIRSL